MVELISESVYWFNGSIVKGSEMPPNSIPADGRTRTMSAKIIAAHNVSDTPSLLRLRFDSIALHDTTYVGVIQTAAASGLKEFSLPCVLTNCHNCLCAVGGTINEDTHVFGLDACKKYGGVFVPSFKSIMHQFNREMMTGCGKMILGGDSHTRYGAFGTMAVGEGGGELAKQMLGDTYDVATPETVAVWLQGNVRPGVGPHDLILSIIGSVFANGFVNNCIMEFIGDGVHNLSVDFRSCVDTMTTETRCWSSIWETDEKVKQFYEIHGRSDNYQKLDPGNGAYYDRAIVVDLSKIEPVIALPFHPSNVYTIRAFKENTCDILRETEKRCMEQLESANVGFSLRNEVVDGQLRVKQGVIGGCAGGSFENLCATAAIIGQGNVSQNNFTLNIYPASGPVSYYMMVNGLTEKLTLSGAIVKPSYCGPCFGIGDVPSNGSLSIRHSTRNFANREGSLPSDGQMAAVALMDARSIAATAVHGGVLTSAMDVDIPAYDKTYVFHKEIYDKSVYFGLGKADPDHEITLSPSIGCWPDLIPLPDNLLLSMATVIHDPVTTTDELIPAGGISAYRSNPMKLAEYTLSRKDPGYVKKAKLVQRVETLRRSGDAIPDNWKETLSRFDSNASFENTGIGTAVYAVKPGDGSAREYAASCQRVLGGIVNIAREYATKRYRSNLINWGMLPLLLDDDFDLESGDYVYLPEIRQAVADAAAVISGYTLYADGRMGKIQMHIGSLTNKEREILLAGSMIGFYKQNIAGL